MKKTDWCHYVYIVTDKNNSVFKINFSHDIRRVVING